MPERKYGIDLLRIVSMFMIVVLHVLLRGGILENTAVLSAQYDVVWIMKIFCMCAVNCYGLISGYVGVNNKFRYYKIWVLWLQVVFYTVIINLIYFPAFSSRFDIVTWTNPIFPVSTEQYWYFTAYFALFFFMPFYNRMLNLLAEKELKILALTILVIIVFIPAVWQNDIFVVKNGYSFLWLSVLYLLGGIIKKLKIEEKISSKKILPCYFLSILLAVLFKLLGEAFPNDSVNQDLLTYYVSPTMMLAAFSLLIIAVKMNFKSKAAVRLISFFSPLSFSVYLIHTNVWIWTYIIKDAFADYAKLHPVLLFLAVTGTAAAIYLICSGIDVIRFYLFKWLRISQRFKAAENRIFEKIKARAETRAQLKR